MSRKIIDKLRDDANYYGSFGKQFLSNSDIGTLLNNPKDFGVSREDNKNFAEGRYFHQSLIEKDKVKDFLFIDTSSRLTNAYKEFCEVNNVTVALLKKEMDEIDKLIQAIKGNITFFDEIYKEGNLYEEPAIAEIKGVKWKGKADIITDEVIIDLKTTSDIQGFKWSAKKYNYDSQAYIYQQLFGKPLIFFVADKQTHQLGIFRPSENFLLGGERKVERAIEVYNTYFGENPTDDIDNYYIDEILD